jgi:membrane peptidoglycan carboxypeptidase
MSKFLPNIYQLKREASTSSLYSFSYLIFVIVIITATILSLLSFGGSWLVAQYEKSATPDEIFKRANPQSTKILASDGTLLFEMFDKENREEINVMEEKGIVAPKEGNYIPLSMQYAMLALEDKNFYRNENGLPINNILGAGLDCVSSGGKNCRGASGIYQQLVKNKTNDDSKSIDRKIQELITTYQLGQKNSQYTHKDVLKMYLNTVGYGRNAHGVQKAAKTYFKKDIKDITVAEACQLASFPQIPPDNNSTLEDQKSSEYEYYKERKETCLDNLSNDVIEPAEGEKAKEDTTFITKEQAELYKKEDIKFIIPENIKKFPHFVDYVIQEIAYNKLTAKGDKIYDKEYDKNNSKETAEYGSVLYSLTLKELKRGGYTIKTTIDPKLQEALERNLSLIYLQGFGGNNYAGVILDGPTGGVKAMVGSKDYKDLKIGGQVNHIARLNPYDTVNSSSWHTVGSTFKIYDYYGALKQGVNPQTQFDNVCRKFANRANNSSNYQGNCSGSGTLEYSLRQSKNIGAIKALYITGNGLNPNYLSGEQDIKGTTEVRALAKRMGVKFLRSDESAVQEVLGSAAAIGSDEVNLLSHAVGINTVAQSGNLRSADPFISITYNENGEQKDSYVEAMSRSNPYPKVDGAEDKAVANQISQVLKINTNNSLFKWSVDNQDVAGKSGTATRGDPERTSDFTIVSFSKKYTSLLWAGNTNTTNAGWQAIADVDSTSTVGLVAMRPLMQEIHKGEPETRFNSDGLQSYNGQLLTPKQIQVYSQARRTF